MIKLQLKDRLAELPYRIQPREILTAKTWPLSTEDLQRIKIIWPEEYQWRGATPIVSAIKDGLVANGQLK